MYFTTESPASYGLGTDEYETNLIKDFIGVKSNQSSNHNSSMSSSSSSSLIINPKLLNEYKGKGLFDVVIIYGCYPNMLEQNNSSCYERNTSKMISKSTFNHFSVSCDHH